MHLIYLFHSLSAPFQRIKPDSRSGVGCPRPYVTGSHRRRRHLLTKPISCRTLHTFLSGPLQAVSSATTIKRSSDETKNEPPARIIPDDREDTSQPRSPIQDASPPPQSEGRAGRRLTKSRKLQLLLSQLLFSSVSPFILLLF